MTVRRNCAIKRRNVLMILSLSLVAFAQVVRLTTMMRLVPLELQTWDHPIISEGISDATFSSCLLIYDDNHFLTEWLAFHYQTLPLRRLVVAIDPRSRTSPSEILQRWQPFMNITEWQDNDYFPLSYKRSIVTSRRYPNVTEKLVLMHRYRQRFFYLRCMQELRQEYETKIELSSERKAQKPHWVTFTDVDEFLFPNRNWKFQFLLPPRKLKGVTIAQLLYRFQTIHTLAGPCVGLPRLLIGTNLDDVDDDFHELKLGDFKENLMDATTQAFQLNNLLTWTWRWHGELRNHDTNKAGKSLIDLSRLSLNSLGLAEVDVHRPIMNCCSIDQMWTSNIDSPLVLHHYVGTMEQFTFRDDPRTGKRTTESYAQYQDVNFSTVHPWDSQHWLVEFVENMGKQQAAYLMQGAGQMEKNVSSPLSEEDFFQLLQDDLFPGGYNTTLAFMARHSQVRMMAAAR